MRIDKIKIKNFKCFEANFEATLNPGVNIIVGNNEAGKSTIVEAIHLALSGMLNGRYLRNELSSYLFNAKAEADYLTSLGTAAPGRPPEIVIELFLCGDGSNHADLEGNGNSERVKASGVTFKIEFDDIYESEYSELLQAGEIGSIPIEYYKVSWTSFARQAITAKSIPLRSAMIDSSSARMHNGSDVYISRIIKENLNDKEKVSISQAHRQMREAFMKNQSVKAINSKITDAAKITNKAVSISVDLSSHSAWESSLLTYIDSIPFHYIGKGEQCLIKTKLALSNRKAAEATVLLIEEPENHLSHSRLNQLISEIGADNGDKQVIITTHSSFVANKLGLDNLVLLRGKNVTRINALEGKEFFQKLAGYDTLRLVLSEKSILVEGDSDELVVQRAYRDANGGKLPIENNIDVISVGTSFLRFLELAKSLAIPVAVATDTDGDLDAIKQKYKDYEGVDPFKICYDETIDTGGLMIGPNKPFNYNTLEPKLLKSNDRATLNAIFDTEFDNDDALLKYMRSHKTECALAIFTATAKITFPDYILKAIAI